MLTHRPTFSAFFAFLFLATAALAQLVAPPVDPKPAPPAPPTPVAAPEVRAVRLSLSSGDALASYAKTANTMRRLRDAGVNTVYISAWNNGSTLFPSATLQKAAGIDRDPSLPEITPAPRPPAAKPEPAKKEYRDLFGEAVLEAHRNGLIAIAWFEGGFLAAKKDADTALKRAKPQWLTKDAQGKAETADGSVWLNPLHAEARQFLFDLILEVAEKYDIDGIQLDERLAWPSPTMGYDEVTKKAFAEEHFGQDPPADANTPAWLKWRGDKSAEFVKRITDEVAKQRPDYVLSRSLAADAPAQALAPWTAWSKAASWSEFAFRIDTLPAASIEKAWSDQLAQAGDAKNKALFTVSITAADKPFAWEDIQKSLDRARVSGATGHILDLQGTNFDAIEKPLAAYYALADKGRAAHPRFGPDHRPAPSKLRLNSYLGPLDSRIWRVMKPVPGVYAVSGVLNNERRTLTGLLITSTTPRKAYEVATPKVYEDVEIIPDRRPQKVSPKK